MTTPDDHGEATEPAEPVWSATPIHDAVKALLEDEPEGE